MVAPITCALEQKRYYSVDNSIATNLRQEIVECYHQEYRLKFWHNNDHIDTNLVGGSTLTLQDNPVGTVECARTVDV